MFFAKISVPVLAAMLLAACGAKPFVSSQAVAVVSAGELPPPVGVSADGEQGFPLGPFDRIVVDVFGFPDLTRREIEVDAAGRFSVPIAGEVIALGLTPAEAASEITRLLRAAHVRDPKVAVNLLDTKSRYVTVEGQVNEPGNYPVLPNLTLMRAIASAKGSNEYARLDDVVVFRTVGDKKMAALYNLGAIRRGTYADPRIYPDDVIVVGNSPGRRVFRDFLTAAPLLISPLIAVFQN